MRRYVHTEWWKEKRTANRKLVWMTPPIFIFFSLLTSQLMAGAPEGKSYLVTVAYNWYPTLILPIVLALLSVNIMGREKPAHRHLFSAQNASITKILFAKLMVLWVNYGLILLLSLLLLVTVEGLLLSHALPWRSLWMATLLLFVANAFVFPLNAWLFSYVGRVGVVLMNFFLFLIGAVVAVTPYWFLFPWCYGVFLMAPVLGIHPNGTFLLQDHPLHDAALIPMGIAASMAACVMMLGLLFALRKKAWQ